jgi:S1-C subfamily serine protease
MSGGAVVNLRGELVGITTTGGNVEGFDAMAGYAVPMDALGRHVVDALIEGREAEYGFLGIRLDERAPNLVGGVDPGTPAADGDLVVGDLIKSVNGRPVNEETGLSLALSTAPVGEPVRLEVDRDGKLLEKTVFLSKYPISGEVIATTKPASWRGVRVDFTSVLAGSTFNTDVLQAMARGCVSVVEVQPGSPAEAAGLRRGQVITRVGDKSVRSPGEFAEVVGTLKGPVELQTDRGPVTIK